MKRKSVMYISNNADLDGAPQSLLNMIKSIRERIKNIVVILPGFGRLEKRLKSMGITYYVIPFQVSYGPIGSENRENNEQNFFSNYEAATKIKEIIEKEKIDLVHSNSSVCNAGAIAALMARVPHIWHVREFLEEGFGYEFWDKDYIFNLMKCADKFISISECVQNAYMQKYGIISERIYNGIDTELYLEEIGNCNKDKNLFLMAGSITGTKGQWDAIKAFHKLVRNGYESIKIVIVGNGDEKFIWSMKRFIKDNQLEHNILIYPFMEDLSSLRRKSQFVIVGSKMEGLGRVTIEAMLAGNVVIGANTGGTVELVGENQQRGFLFQQGNVDDLAGVIKRLVNQEDDYKELLQRAQTYAKENFNLQSYCENLLNVYDKVLSNFSFDRKKEELLQFSLERYKDLEHRESLLSVISQKSHDTYCNKLKKIIEIEKRWLAIRQSGRAIYEYFQKRGIKKIAIYGMGDLGMSLYDELDGTGIEIAYVVDKNPNEHIAGVISIKHPEEKWEPVDMLVFALATNANNIMQQYENKYSFRMKSLVEIINSFHL